MTQPVNGSLSGTAPNLTYTHDGSETTADSFTYSANDGTVDSSPATVSITITPVNDPPVADSQSVNTPEGVAVDIALTASDAEGNPLTYSVAAPSHGILSGAAPALTYTPDNNYTGPDSFTFTVNDGEFDSEPAMVTITVTGGGTMHIGDLDGGSVISGRGNKWTANVTITVHDAGESLVDGATVSGNWSNGAKGGGSCTTGESGPGKCTVSKNGLKTNVGTATFTVTDVTHASLSYSVVNVNHDPDIPVDSTGTAITITLP